MCFQKSNNNFIYEPILKMCKKTWGNLKYIHVDLSQIEEILEIASFPCIHKYKSQLIGRFEDLNFKKQTLASGPQYLTF